MFGRTIRSMIGYSCHPPGVEASHAHRSTARQSSATLVLDPLGTFVFALSGAVSSVKDRLDIFGVLAYVRPTILHGRAPRCVLPWVPPRALSR